MTTATMNGHVPSAPPERDRLEDRLIGEPLSQGYKPTLPLWTFWNADSTTPQFYLLRDIELMMMHPICRNALNYFKGGISGAEFDLICDHQEAGPFIMDHCGRYWDKGVPLLQGGYEYGWIGCENMYSDHEGPLRWEGLMQFSPRDVFLLKQNNRPIGVRVKNVPENPEDVVLGREQGGGFVDLWMATRDVPAKALWYAHNPRYSQFYGQSQFLGAWKPWRRLAWKDGAETTIDGGVYRFAYTGPLIRYPEEDIQGQPGAPATTNDSQGNPRKYARDLARQIGEWFKAGAAVGLPSTKYPSEMGGDYKWSADFPKSTLNVSGLIEYIKYLCDQICYGVGVPPELMAASETGSGYSGRAIPLEGFMLLQQRLADAMLHLFVNQVLRPLVRWNFGEVKFEVKVKSLMETKRKAQMGEDGAAGGQEQPGSAMPGVPTPPAPGPRDASIMPPTDRQAPRVPGPGGAPMSIIHPTLITDRVWELARRILKAA